VTTGAVRRSPYIGASVSRGLVRKWPEVVALAAAYRTAQGGRLYALYSYAYLRLRGKYILKAKRVLIHGVRRIETAGLCQIGMADVGFMNKYDRTYLNVRGRLIFTGPYSIGKGCRFDIGEEAVAKFGEGYVNANTSFIIMHGLTVGRRCAISWGCQFLDDDFHRIGYASRCGDAKGNAIHIGNHVWIGSNVTLLKRSVIPDGCVVASGAVVTKPFDQQDALIAGNPARVIRANIKWE